MTDPEQPSTLPVPLFPTFEGKPVEASALKLANSSVLNLPDVVLGMDDVFQIVVEAKVVGVNHVVHEASGKLIRVHTAKAFDARLIPFNPTYDDGIDRA